jgi:hypothetical protein
MQNDEHFYTYRRSVKLRLITNASLIDARGLLPNARMANEPTRFPHKNQGAPDRRSSLLLILFTRAVPHTKSKVLPIDVPLYF